MKILCKLNGKEVLKEVYKVQVSIFGTPSILIYNENRTEMYETHNPKEINAIQNFIGKFVNKTYAAGYLNDNGQIIMERVIPYKISRRYNW